MHVCVCVGGGEARPGQTHDRQGSRSLLTPLRSSSSSRGERTEGQEMMDKRDNRNTKHTEQAGRTRPAPHRTGAVEQRRAVCLLVLLPARWNTRTPVQAHNETERGEGRGLARVTATVRRCAVALPVNPPPPHRWASLALRSRTDGLDKKHTDMDGHGGVVPTTPRIAIHLSLQLHRLCEADDRERGRVTGGAGGDGKGGGRRMRVLCGAHKNTKANFVF